MKNYKMHSKLLATIVCLSIMLSCFGFTGLVFADDIAAVSMFNNNFDYSNFTVGSSIPGTWSPKLVTDWMAGGNGTKLVKQDEGSDNKYGWMSGTTVASGTSSMLKSGLSIKPTKKFVVSGKLRISSGTTKEVGAYIYIDNVLFSAIYSRYDDINNVYELYTGGLRQSMSTASWKGNLIAKVAPDTWFDYSMVLDPVMTDGTTDWSNFSYNTFVSGNVMDASGVSVPQIKFTKTNTNFTYNKASNLCNGFIFWLSTVGGASSEFSFDDINIYYPGTTNVATISQTEDVITNGQISVSLSNPLDFSTVDSSAVTVAPINGGSAVNPAISINPNDSKNIVLDFADNPLQSGTEYRVTVNPSLKDIFGSSIGTTNTIDFTSGSTNTGLASLTYKIGDENEVAIPDFSVSDETKTYNIERTKSNVTSVTLNAVAGDSNSTLTMNPSDGVINMVNGAGTGSVSVTSSEGTKTYTVNFRIYNEIASLAINTPSNLVQDIDSITPIDFSVDVAPNENTKNSTITWYADNIMQTTGTTFTYTPTVKGTHEVYAAVVGTNVKSAVQNVVVAREADKHYESLFSENFDTYTVDTGVPAGGLWAYNCQGTIKSDDGINNYTKIGQAGAIGKLLTMVNLTLDAPYVNSGKFAVDTSSTGFTNIGLYNNGSYRNCITLNPVSGTEYYTIMFAGTNSNVKFKKGDWLKYNMYVTPGRNEDGSDDWTKSTIKAYFSGDMIDANENNISYLTLQTTNFNAVGNKLVYNTAADSYIYIDDISIYRPGIEDLAVATISKADNVSVLGTVTLDLNRDANLETVSADNISVTPVNGGNTIHPKVTFDYNNPNKIVLDFSSNQLDWNTEYKVTFGSNLKDVADANYTVSNNFTTSEQNARLGNLTYKIGDGEFNTVTGFDEADESKTYDVEIFNTGLSQVTLDARASDPTSTTDLTSSNNVVNIANGVGSKTITVTSATGDKNTYTINFRVYNVISALTINTPSNLDQELSSLSNVIFSVTSNPADNIKDSTINWFVNDTLQETTGKDFTYVPSSRGNYNVYAKVNGTDVATETKTVSVVAESDKYYTSIISDDFEKYDVGGAVPSGSMGIWSPNNRQAMVIRKDEFTKCAGVGDSANYGRLLSGIVSFTTPIRFSGSFLIENQSTANMFIAIYNKGNQKQFITFVPYDDNYYTFKIGNTLSNVKIPKDEWFRVNAYIEPSLNADQTYNWAKSHIKLTVSGNLINESGENIKNATLTLDSFDADGNMLDIYTLAGTYIKVDDVNLYQPGQGNATATINNEDNVSVIGKVILKADRDLDLSTITSSCVSVTPVNGGNTIYPNVTYDASKPYEIILDFANATLDWNKKYNVTINDSVKDYIGKNVTTSAVFTTDGQNAKLASLTYEANGDNKTVTGFTSDDLSKTYNIHIANSAITSVKINPVAADFGSTVVISPADGNLTLENGVGTATVTVTSNDGTKTNTYTLVFNTVDEISSLAINTPSNLTQTANNLTSVEFTATANSENIDESAINWYINDVLQSNTGKTFDFLPTGDGVYSIYAKAYGTDIKTETKTVSVGSVSEMIPVTSITIDPEKLTLWADFDIDCVLATTVLPETATNKTVRFKSSDTSIATVDPITGNVKPVSEGFAVITATSTDGSNITSNSFALTVTPAKNRGENQKLNLDPVGNDGPRIDIDTFLSWPQNIGEGQVALWKDNRTGAFSITADDSLVDDFSTWNDYNDKYGFPITLFVPTKYLGYTSNWNQAQNEYGLDVQSHTDKHYSYADCLNLTSAQKIYEAWYPKEVINTLVPNANCQVIAHSWGYYDPEGSTREFYIGGRGTGGMPNYGDSVDYNSTGMIEMHGGVNFYTKSESTEKKLSMESVIKTLYDKNYYVYGRSFFGGWVVTLDHKITPLPNAEPSYNEELGEYCDTVQYIDKVCSDLLKPASDANQLWVASFKDAAMYGQERDTSNLTITSSDATAITYNLTDEMDDTVFDMPLTVKIKVDNSWSNIIAEQNGKFLSVSEKTVDGQKYALIETVPDRGEVTLSPFGIIGEIKLNSLNNIATATFNYNNNDDNTNLSYKLYIAGYDDTTLLNVAISDLQNISTVGDGSFSISLPITSDMTKIKAFAMVNDTYQPMTILETLNLK